MHDGRLEVESGLVFRSRVTLGIDGHLAVALDQGPLMRRCGIWSLRVQCAHSVGPHAVGVSLLGVQETEALRARLLELAARAALAERSAA